MRAPSGARWISKFRLKSDTWVFVPNLGMVKYGLQLKNSINSRWKAPDNYFHLRSGGHVAALKYHEDGVFFIHADLKKFFNRINKTRVTRALKPIFGYLQALDISKASTAPITMDDGIKVIALPFGFVQSTLIASICLYTSKLGRVIEELDREEGVKVSVYVDDIIISTQSEEAALRAMEHIKEASERSALPLNEAKLEGPARGITAFNIDLKNSSLLVSDQRISEFIRDYKSSGNSHQKSGIVNYIESVNSLQAAWFKTQV